METVVSDGPHVRKAERRLFDSIVETIAPRSIPTRRLKEIERLLSRQKLPTDYVQAYDDKVTRSNALRELQAAADAAFKESKNPRGRASVRAASISVSPARTIMVDQLQSHQSASVEKLGNKRKAEESEAPTNEPKAKRRAVVLEDSDDGYGYVTAYESQRNALSVSAVIPQSSGMAN